MRRTLRFLLTITLFAIIPLALFGVGAWWATGFVPDRWKPWAPLHLEDEPNLLTHYKLHRLRNDPAQCLGLLAQSSLRFTQVRDETMKEGCEYRNAVRVDSSEVSYSNRFTATCNLAASLALFERHTLQPAAMAVFGQPVARIEHMGTYACRTINNRTTGALSEHATANAIDLSGFVLRDGTKIDVKTDWPASPEIENPKNLFLRRIHAGACRFFSSVLGPDYNVAHHNHFHADIGRYSICR